MRMCIGIQDNHFHHAVCVGIKRVAIRVITDKHTWCRATLSVQRIDILLRNGINLCWSHSIGIAKVGFVLYKWFVCFTIAFNLVIAHSNCQRCLSKERLHQIKPSRPSMRIRICIRHVSHYMNKTNRMPSQGRECRSINVCHCESRVYRLTKVTDQGNGRRGSRKRRRLEREYRSVCDCLPKLATASKGRRWLSQWRQNIFMSVDLDAIVVDCIGFQVWEDDMIYPIAFKIFISFRTGIVEVQRKSCCSCLLLTDVFAKKVHERSRMLAFVKIK